MGYDVEYTGTIKLDPPLSAGERAAVRRLADQRQHEPGDVNRIPDGMPGYWFPWTATRRGHLKPPAWPDRSGMLPEWLRWLPDAVLGRPTRMQGRVHARGRAPGDEWRLVADTDRLVVERDRLPCPACWLNCLTLVPPSAAYRFRHPEPDGNLDIETLTGELHSGLLERYEARCLDFGFSPVERSLDVVWPPPPGSPPPVPPFQVKFAELLAGSDLPMPEFQAWIRG
jgi:hypothetical protein